MFEKAKRELSYADHLYRVTLKTVKEKHVYSNIINHLYSAFLFSIKEFLKNQRMRKLIKVLPTTDELSIDLFRDEFGDLIPDKKLFEEFLIVAKANEEKYEMLIKEGSLIIMLKNFKMIRVDEEDIANYISMINVLINRLEGETSG